MKRTLLSILVGTTLLLSGCSNEQPKPPRPVIYTGVPRETHEVTGRWKMGEFTIGYRIVTDDYVIASGVDGLYGQNGGLAGPGLVDHATVRSFGEIFHLAKQAIGGKEEMTFHGHLLHNKDGTPHLFEGKKVIILYDATFRGTSYEVNRRP